MIFLYKIQKDFQGLPVVSDELHVVSLVTLFNAVHADGVAVCCVTGVAPAGKQRITQSVTHTHTQNQVQGKRLEARADCKQRDYQRCNGYKL